MNLPTLLAASILLSTTAAFAADGNFDRTLRLTGTPTITVSTGSGYIHVYPGTGNLVHIVGHVHSVGGWWGNSFGGSDEARVREIVTDPPIDQTGNRITVSSQRSNSRFFSPIVVDYDITVPSSATLAAHTGSGSIEIGGIEGEVTASAGSGSLHLDNVGPSPSLQTGSGRIVATNIHGTAYAQTGSGSISLSFASPGEATAHTGSGSIHIEGARKGVRASTGSGPIELYGDPTSEWDAHTGSGSIHLHPVRNAHFTLRVDVGSGGIHTVRPIAVQDGLNRHHLLGTVNGGGPSVRAQTGSGSVSLD